MTTENEQLIEAARLAFAIIRFGEGAAHPARGSTPAGALRLGVDAYAFAPSSPLIPVGDVPAFLAQLSAPAFLLTTPTRGIVSLHLLNELSPERARSMEHELENQREGLNELADQMGLPAESRVLLEFGDEVHVHTLEVVRMWAGRFAINVGWNITALQEDSRADARLNLFRADGENSVGAPGPRKTN